MLGSNTSFDWAQVVTWGLVIAGWLFVDRKNNEREKRKEIRALVDKTQSMLDQIEEGAVRYHTQGHDDHLARSIKVCLYRKLPDALKIANLRGIMIEDQDRRIIDLRQAITLHNFDSANRYTPLSLNESTILSIGEYKDILSSALEVAYHKQYR